MIWLAGQMWLWLLLSALAGAAVTYQRSTTRITVERLVRATEPETDSAASEAPARATETPTAAAPGPVREPVTTPVAEEADDDFVSPFPIRGDEPAPWQEEELWSRPARVASSSPQRSEDEWSDAATNWRSWADRVAGKPVEDTSSPPPGVAARPEDWDMFAEDRAAAGGPEGLDPFPVAHDSVDVDDPGTLPTADDGQDDPRLDREQALREQIEAERLAWEREEAERLERERVQREQMEVERLAWEREQLEIQQRLERERAEAERLEAERLERERAEAERLEAERLEAERLERERAEAERLEAERLEAERAEAERLEAERLEAERLEAERLEAERLEAERLEAERLERERAEAERLERERRERDRVEGDRLRGDEQAQDRLERARRKIERAEAERLEAERLEAERREAERRAQAARVEQARRRIEQAQESEDGLDGAGAETSSPAKPERTRRQLPKLLPKLIPTPGDPGRPRASDEPDGPGSVEATPDESGTGDLSADELSPGPRTPQTEPAAWSAPPGPAPSRNGTSVHGDQQGEAPDPTPGHPYGPGSAQAPFDGSMPPGYPIKGNESLRVYHTEKSRLYTRMTADVWFESEEAAQAAGFVRWDRRGSAAHTIGLDMSRGE